MFSRISAADAAALNASRVTVAARAAETTAQLNVRKVEDSISFIGRFERVQEVKKSATATAAVGQGAPRADPPAKLLITPVNIEELVAKASEANEHYYRPTGPNSIELVATDSKRIKEAKKAFEKAVTSYADAEKLPGGVPAALIEQRKLAEEEYHAAKVPRGKVHIKTGEGIFISWFGKGKEKTLTSGSLVTVNGCTGTFSIGKNDGKEYVGVNCEAVIPMGGTEHPITTNSRYTDLFQTVFQRCDTSKKYGGKAVILFDDYVRSEEDTAAGRGPVVKRIFTPPNAEEEYLKRGKTDTDESVLIAKLVMTQFQETGPGGAIERRFVNAAFWEGGWDKPTEKNEIRKNWGFVGKVEDCARFMAANPVPALALCSENVKDTQKTDIQEIVPFYANTLFYMLHEYLTSNCLRPSFQWVRKALGIKPTVDDADAVISKANVNRPCLLNMQNLLSSAENDSNIFIGNKLINVSAFSGNIGQLKAQGCEFRVMTTAHFEPAVRQMLAGLDAAEADKILDRAEGAKVQLPDNCLRIIYALIPRTKEETDNIMAAIDSWREHRKPNASQAAAASDHGGPTGMEIDDRHLHPLTGVKTEEQQKAEEEAAAAAEALRAEEEAEAEAAAIRAAEEAEAAAQQKKKRSRATPPPAGEKPAAQGRKKKAAVPSE